jgi:hypothetical protein
LPAPGVCGDNTSEQQEHDLPTGHDGFWKHEVLGEMLLQSSDHLQRNLRAGAENLVELGEVFAPAGCEAPRFSGSA